MTLPISVLFEELPEAPSPRVVEIELDQEIDEPFRLSLTLETGELGVVVEDLIGSGATVSLTEHHLGRVRGVVREVRRLAESTSRAPLHRLEIVPWAWLLTKRQNSRIFQDRSIPEIVADIAADFEGQVEVAQRLVEPHPKRSYVVQFDETDWDFIRRLAAEEGISLLFDLEHGGRLELVDDTTVGADSSAVEIPRRRLEGAIGEEGPSVTEATLRRELRCGRIALRDVDPARPRHAIATGAEGARRRRAGENGIERFAYAVGRTRDEGEGRLLATRLLEAERSGESVLSCTSNFAFPVGRHLRVRDADDDLGDAPSLVTRARFSARSTSGAIDRKASFEGVPSAARRRPPTRPKPRIAGTQTATVLGAPGEVIDVDALGRVEVRFHWDRRDPETTGATRRVRVSQGWGGAGFGMMALPRVGDEVVVSFVDGDPDEPMIVGNVHNAVNPTPAALPGAKTQTVWRSQSLAGDRTGFNEISMEDAAGAEVLGLRAERNLDVTALGNELVMIGGSSARQVSGSQEISVDGSQVVSIGGSEDVVVGGLASLSSEDASVTASKSLTAHAPSLALTAAARQDVTSGMHMINASMLLLAARDALQINTESMVATASKDIVFLVGQSFLRLGPDGIELGVPGCTLSLGAAGATIEATGIVDVKGAFIKLNS